MSNEAWKPIGNDVNRFTGTFDGGGQGAEISGGTADNENSADLEAGSSDGQISDAAFWRGLGFDDTAWDLDFTAAGRGYMLPWFKNMDNQLDGMPGHLQ